MQPTLRSTSNSPESEAFRGWLCAPIPYSARDLPSPEELHKTMSTLTNEFLDGDSFINAMQSIDCEGLTVYFDHTETMAKTLDGLHSIPDLPAPPFTLTTEESMKIIFRIIAEVRVGLLGEKRGEEMQKGIKAVLCSLDDGNLRSLYYHWCIFSTPPGGSKWKVGCKDPWVEENLRLIQGMRLPKLRCPMTFSCARTFGSLDCIKKHLVTEHEDALLSLGYMPYDDVILVNTPHPYPCGWMVSGGKHRCSRAFASAEELAEHVRMHVCTEMEMLASDLKPVAWDVV